MTNIPFLTINDPSIKSTWDPDISVHGLGVAFY